MSFPSAAFPFYLGCLLGSIVENRDDLKAVVGDDLITDLENVMRKVAETFYPAAE